MEGRLGPSKNGERFLEMGVKNVVITLGPKGLFFKNRSEEFWMKAFKVNRVDTTAAGDAFLGALAAGLSENKPIHEALRFANGPAPLLPRDWALSPLFPLERTLRLFFPKRNLNIFSSDARRWESDEKVLFRDWRSIWV